LGLVDGLVRQLHLSQDQLQQQFQCALCCSAGAHVVAHAGKQFGVGIEKLGVQRDTLWVRQQINGGLRIDHWHHRHARSQNVTNRERDILARAGQVALFATPQRAAERSADSFNHPKNKVSLVQTHALPR
jgi:hypothetical protein